MSEARERARKIYQDRKLEALDEGEAVPRFKTFAEQVSHAMTLRERGNTDEAIASMMNLSLDTVKGFLEGTRVISDDHEAYIRKAKVLVADVFNSEFPNLRYGAVPDHFYVVWFAKSLQNWKAMVSTDLMNDMYWEVTHNGDKQETYVDYYKKQSNRSFSDSSYEGLIQHNSSTSQDRVERDEFRDEVHKAAVMAVKGLKYMGRDNKGIAAELGISESVVRVLLVP